MNTLEHPTVGQLVVERPARARVFERLGIDYCCGGKRPLEQVCREKNLDYSEVLAALDDATLPPSTGERNWSAASITDLCDHIEQTHHTYLKQELPRLEFLTGKVANRHGDRLPFLNNVHQLFMEMKEELEQHTMKEERVLFPLCRQLDAADVLPPMHCGSVANPIQVMVREHEDAGDALAKIRALTDDYTCPPDACNTFRAMYDALHAFERDLHQHVHKENNILFPKAIRLEALLSQSRG